MMKRNENHHYVPIYFALYENLIFLYEGMIENTILSKK